MIIGSPRPVDWESSGRHRDGRAWNAGHPMAVIGDCRPEGDEASHRQLRDLAWEHFALTAFATLRMTTETP